MDFFNQALYDLSNDMIGVFGFDWYPRKLNKAWRQELGWTEEELLKTCFRDIIHPDDILRAQEVFKEISNGQIFKDLQFRYRCKNGGYKYFLWNVQMFPEQGIIYGVAKNITQRLMHDEVLRQTNKVAKIGIWNIDLMSQEIYWSPEIYEIFGLKFGRDALDAEASINFFSPEYRDRVRDSYLSLISGGPDYDFEASIVSAQGVIVPVRIMGSSFKENGVISRAFGIIQDISRSKQGEQALRYQQHLLNGLLDSSPAVIYVKDLQGRYIIINRQFERIFKMSKAQLLGKTDFDLFSEKDAIRHIKNDQETLQTQASVKSSDDITQDDGIEHHYLSEKFPLFDEKGKVIALAGVSTDVTELRDSHEAMMKAKNRAEAGTRAKSDFLANMSHEIRTPMNAIVGMSEVLLDSGLNEDQKRFMLILSRAAENLLKIINEILDLSKIESGQMSFELAPYSVEEVVKRSVELLMITAVTKKLTLSYEVAADIPALVLGDFMRVQQVLINLVGNALKFTTEGSVKVRVLKELSPGAEDLLRFEVSDTGIGLDVDQKDWIFGRFTQGDPTIARRFGGTGLGLSISQELVEKMGGKIGVNSQLGAGAQFYFTLPLKKIE